MSQDTKTLEIVLKGRDDGLTSLLGTANRQVSTLAQQLRQGGDIGELSGVKKFGKNVGEFLGTSQAGEISKGADQLRAQAQADYGESVKKVADAEQMAIAVDKARTGAILERTAASQRLNQELKAIDAAERKGINATASPSKRAEIRETAGENREAAEKAYQEVVARTADVEKRATANDVERKKAINEKTAAAQKYAQTLKEIDKAEAAAQKQNRKDNAVGRGIAVAGGTLAAINIAGGIAEAYDKANQKLEEGKIKAAEFAGEFAKGLPIIGGTVQKAETLLMVITGTAKALRDANKEAAELDKKINGQNADRKRVDDLVKGTVGLNDSDKDRINREANAKLKEIRDARAAARASGADNEGTDRDIASKKAEAEIIKKREADLAKVEAAEREARARQVEAVEERLFQGKKTIEDQRTAQRIADLKEQGKEQEAAVLEIQAKTAEKLAALDRDREKLTGEKGLTDRQRIDINNSIDAQKTAASAAGQAEIAASNRAAARTAEEKLKQAEEKLASELERQQGERVKQGQESIANQRAPRSSITDARGQSGFISQSREFITPQVEAKKSTDANTKATEELTKTIAALKDVIAGLGGGTNNAGFIE